MVPASQVLAACASRGHTRDGWDGRWKLLRLYHAAADMQELRYGKDDVDVVHCRAKARELSA